MSDRPMPQLQVGPGVYACCDHCEHKDGHHRHLDPCGAAGCPGQSTTVA